MPVLTDTFRHKGLRRRMILELREHGIQNEQVLEVMGKVPRHQFLDSAFDHQAYANKPFAIGNDQTISQPYTVAAMTDALDVQAGQRILEIGTGSGYQSAILAELGAHIYSIERHAALASSAEKLLRQMGYTTIQIRYGDGYQGWPECAPFDRIIVTAAALEIPQPLIEQLKNGGILVIPVGRGEVQMMHVIRKDEKGRLHDVTVGQYRFVPLLQGTGT